MPSQKIIPVKPSAPVSLSLKAQEIHSWLLSEHEQHGNPIRVGDVIQRHGETVRTFSPMGYAKILSGRRLEELLDNSLIYVAEDGQ